MFLKSIIVCLKEYFLEIILCASSDFSFLILAWDCIKFKLFLIIQDLIYHEKNKHNPDCEVVIDN